MSLDLQRGVGGGAPRLCVTWLGAEAKSPTPGPSSTEKAPGLGVPGGLYGVKRNHHSNLTTSPFVNEKMRLLRAEWLPVPTAYLCHGLSPAPEEDCLGLTAYDCCELWVSIHTALLNFSLGA